MADGITPPVLLERVEPVYPELNRQMRRQGRSCGIDPHRHGRFHRAGDEWFAQSIDG